MKKRTPRAIAHKLSIPIPLVSHFFIAVASLGYIGFTPLFPGTTASLVTLAALAVLGPFSTSALLVTASGLFAIGFALSYLIEKRTGDHDPSWIVIDECVGMMVAIVGLPHTPVWLGAAFILFRIFDISKWSIIGWADSLPNGFGVMLDDLLAGVLTCGILHVIHALFCA